MAITHDLATWLVKTKPLAKGRALELARNAMVDIVGCMVAGGRDVATCRTLDAVRDLGNGPASGLGKWDSGPCFRF